MNKPLRSMLLVIGTILTASVIFDPTPQPILGMLGGLLLSLSIMLGP